MASRGWTWVLAGLMAAGAAAPSQGAGFFEMNFYMSGPRYEAEVPLCNEGGPLHSIAAKFHTKEYRFWNSELSIVDFQNVREITFRPWAAAAIPRRFCRADAVVSDGVRRPIYYSIVEGGGIIGAGWGVEFCVVGLDRNWAFNPACKMAKP